MLICSVWLALGKMDICGDGRCRTGKVDRESQNPTWHDLEEETEGHILLVPLMKPHPVTSEAMGGPPQGPPKGRTQGRGLSGQL